MLQGLPILAPKVSAMASAEAREELEKVSTGKLKRWLVSKSVDIGGCLEKADLIERALSQSSLPLSELFGSENQPPKSEKPEPETKTKETKRQAKGSDAGKKAKKPKKADPKDVSERHQTAGGTTIPFRRFVPRALPKLAAKVSRSHLAPRFAVSRGSRRQPVRSREGLEVLCTRVDLQVVRGRQGRAKGQDRGVRPRRDDHPDEERPGLREGSDRLVPIQCQGLRKAGKIPQGWLQSGHIQQPGEQSLRAALRPFLTPLFSYSSAILLFLPSCFLQRQRLTAVHAFCTLCRVLCVRGFGCAREE